MPLLHILIRRLFQSTWKHWMFPEEYLLLFLASYFYFYWVRNDHIVSTIHYISRKSQMDNEQVEINVIERTARIIDRFMFPHQHQCNPFCQFTQYTVRCIDMVPYSGICQSRLKNNKLSENYPMNRTDILTFPTTWDMVNRLVTGRKKVVPTHPSCLLRRQSCELH